ncbi:tobamovirus multiplication protein 2A-like [Corylus avellana]|uniref:tobamovirus multiplication protein 2A-like n=1 Tax=Corylus avellana TaxID=13451 RepID=UPI00286B3E72|nr:tobamovirus multiplication protein 2A-like [Corylus avellana]
MAKRPFVEFLLQLINFIFSLCGLGVLFYGLFCLIKWKQQASVQSDHHDTDEAEHPIDDCSILIHRQCCLIGFLQLELAVAAFMIIDHSWNKVVPADRSGNFYSVYYFLNKNWTIMRWIALAVLILQVIALLLALYLRYVFSRAKHVSSDDESVDYPRKLQAFVGRKSK